MITLTDNQLAILRTIADEDNTVVPIWEYGSWNGTLEQVICHSGPDEESLDTDDVQFLMDVGLIDLDVDQGEDERSYTYYITDDGENELRPYEPQPEDAAATQRLTAKS